MFNDGLVETKSHAFECGVKSDGALQCQLWWSGSNRSACLSKAFDHKPKSASSLKFGSIP